ncbi:MAG TPA: YbaK/EbsC family protein [Actinomycetota bacterium]|nr:YbaK/EbsC family protein [Actinomycetota bacterium]
MSGTIEYLERKGIPFQTIEHERAFTPVAEAQVIGVPAHLVIKTLVLDTKWGRVLAVVPGDRRLDMRLVREAVGDHHARLATEEEIRAELPDFELGCIPPLGMLLGLPVYVDGHVMRHEEVVFAAGSSGEAVRARVVDLFDHERVTVAHIATEPVEAYV